MLLGIPRSARCVQRFDDSLKICNSHYLSQFAAFFIDARTKRSVVESFSIFHFLAWAHGPSDDDRNIRDFAKDLPRETPSYTCLDVRHGGPGQGSCCPGEATWIGTQ